jgi:hypothetical protein
LAICRYNLTACSKAQAIETGGTGNGRHKRDSANLPD